MRKGEELIILHPYTPEARPKDQIETWEFLKDFEKKHPEHKIIHAEVHTEYEHLINNLWREKGDFVILEHDIVPTEEQLLEIINCISPLCAAWYWCYPVSTYLKQPIRSIRDVGEFKYESDELVVLSWKSLDNLSDEELDKKRWCAVYPLGLTKFGKEVMEKVPVSAFFDEKNTNPQYWKQYDTRIGIATYRAGFRCHIHKEVKHNHKGDEPEPTMAFGTLQR